MKKVLFISCVEEWYKMRLEPMCKCMTRNGYKVLCVLSDYNHINKSYSQKENESCIYIHVPAYRNNISLKRIISHMVFGKKVNYFINKYKPDIIYLLMPPNNTARYCLKYKFHYPKTKLILDIIDLWPETIPMGRVKDTLPANIWRKWRDDAIDAADYVVTECELYQEKIKINKSKSTVLYLFKEQTKVERELVKSIIQTKDNRESINNRLVKFAYLGSINNIIDIEGICKVINQFIMCGYRCELHAIGNGESREYFKSKIDRIGCKGFFYGSIFDEVKKIKILASCDYALNMMKDTSQVGLTIKSIDYLAYGLPLLNNIKGDTQKLVDKYKIGFNVNDNNIEIIGRINREKVLEVYNKLFSKKVFAESYEKILSSL